MEFKVLFSEDPAFVLSRAGGFLSSQPVLHNLVLSILHARVAQGDPGRYWRAIRTDDKWASQERFLRIGSIVGFLRQA